MSSEFRENVILKEFPIFPTDIYRNTNNKAFTNLNWCHVCNHDRSINFIRDHPIKEEYNGVLNFNLDFAFL
jgi:hypothetical protein